MSGCHIVVVRVGDCGMKNQQILTVVLRSLLVGESLRFLTRSVSMRVLCRAVPYHVVCRVACYMRLCFAGLINHAAGRHKYALTARLSSECLFIINNRNKIHNHAAG